MSNKVSDQKIHLLLVDDHVVVRQGLKMLLDLETGLEVIGEASNGQEALYEVERLRPDVILMDLKMPLMDGISAIRAIKPKYPDVEIIALTSVLEDQLVINAVEAGAAGYLLKEGNSDMLIEAIYAAQRGEVRLHPDAKKRLSRELRTPDMRESLTPRETDTLRLVARGYANKEIAEALSVSELTIKTHVSSILSKLNLQSRTQAALFALKEGLIGIESIEVLGSEDK
ncbi:MAG: response regulator transcription factor [Deinococcales bacterium]